MSISDFSAIANIIVAAATGLMAFSTWRMASVTKKAFDEQNKPCVIVYPRPREDSPQILEIVIENIGISPAYDIKFGIPDNFYLRAYGIEKADRPPYKIRSGAFIDGIPHLAPKQIRVFDWGQFGGIRDSLGGNTAKITIEFSDHTRNRKYTTESVLDINDFSDSTANMGTATRQVKVLEGIHKDFKTYIRRLPP